VTHHFAITPLTKIPTGIYGHLGSMGDPSVSISCSGGTNYLSLDYRPRALEILCLPGACRFQITRRNSAIEGPSIIK
jgi:hypothetical protein